MSVQSGFGRLFPSRSRLFRRRSLEGWATSQALVLSISLSRAPFPHSVSWIKNLNRNWLPVPSLTRSCALSKSPPTYRPSSVSDFAPRTWAYGWTMQRSWLPSVPPTRSGWIMKPDTSRSRSARRYPVRRPRSKPRHRPYAGAWPPRRPRWGSSSSVISTTGRSSAQRSASNSSRGMDLARATLSNTAEGASSEQNTAGLATRTQPGRRSPGTTALHHSATWPSLASPLLPPVPGAGTDGDEAMV
mmetsp:Transcript_15230/g.45098  ORF Transcript_15230/g.45098 Transcript_15230/m.45098 type:complete len:245 (-) Transcript_15230:307-1041(-)